MVLLSQSHTAIESRLRSTVQSSLRFLWALGLEVDIEVVAEVSRGDEVVAAVRTTMPDVALLDIEMPGGTGLDALEQMQAEGKAKELKGKAKDAIKQGLNKV